MPRACQDDLNRDDLMTRTTGAWCIRTQKHGIKVTKEDETKNKAWPEWKHICWTWGSARTKCAGLDAGFRETTRKCTTQGVDGLSTFWGEEKGVLELTPSKQLKLLLEARGVVMRDNENSTRGDANTWPREAGAQVCWICTGSKKCMFSTWYSTRNTGMEIQPQPKVRLQRLQPQNSIEDASSPCRASREMHVKWNNWEEKQNQAWIWFILLTSTWHKNTCTGMANPCKWWSHRQNS